MVKNIYRGAQEAKAQGKKVAYFMVASQFNEILRAMNVRSDTDRKLRRAVPAKRDMDRFLLKAEADGYSQVLCSYTRIGLGFDSLRKDLGGVPEDATGRRDAAAGHDARQQRRLRPAFQMVPGSRTLHGCAHSQY